MSPGGPIEARRVDVRLGDRAYQVQVGAGILATIGQEIRRLMPRAGRAFVAIDHHLPESTVDVVLGALRTVGLVATTEVVVADEPSKVMSVAEGLAGMMTASRHERGDPVVALGGGIVGDLAGFAASIYRRGVPVVQCPTTLLSMVDASVGGKCGANLMVGGVLKKNMVGTFHQPVAVLCDVAALASLPIIELRCGLAECIKHALIGAAWGDAGLWDWTAANIPRFVAGDVGALVELVERNVRIKVQVVAGDEREERTDGRGRMCLNMGHTVGHAIETMACVPVVAGSGEAERVRLRHGEAVGLGLIAEATYGELDGVTEAGTARRIVEVLERAGLPIKVRGLPSWQSVASAMMDDKKVVGSQLRMAVPTGRGECVVVTPATDGVLERPIESILA